MKIVKEGDSHQAICDNCGVVNATYRLRDVEFTDQAIDASGESTVDNDGSKLGVVKNVLAGVCDQCHHVVSIPPQSVPQVKAAYDKHKAAIDVRLPAHYLDILCLASARVAPELGDSFNKPLLLFYLHALSTGHYSGDNLTNLLQSELAQAKASKRISLKASRSSTDAIQTLINLYGLKNNTEVFKSVILKINQDILQTEEPSNLSELQHLAAALG